LLSIRHLQLLQLWGNWTLRTAILSIALASCAHTPAGLPLRLESTPLLGGQQFFPHSNVPELADPELLTLTDEMRTLVHDRTASAKTDQQKIRAILKTILQEESTTVQYNLVKTYSAADVFAAKEGNCLSFTNLFIAMAREAGLDAYYQRVDIPPTWDENEGTYIFNLHINAVVDMAPLGKKAVDFDVSNFSTQYHMWRVSDEHAQAQFHNNMGVHLLGTKDFGTAFLHFRRAIEISPEIGYFWTNLGTLYRRSGNDRYAEQAFLAAIERSSAPAALSNLARLYRDQNNVEAYDHYMNKVKNYHRKNPYYHYRRAENAYAAQDFNQTTKILKQAIRLRKDDHRFYQLLALSHLRSGELKSAKENFHKAAQYAIAGADREKYNHKYELLKQIH